MRALVLALSVWAFVRGSARAEDLLLVHEQPALRPGLCAALRIQLTDLAEVRCEPDPDPDQPLLRRLEAAAAALRQRDGELVVLLERDANPALIRMLVVGAAPDRALLAVEQVEARPAPEVDRSLALKVRETLETSLAARAVLPAESAAAPVLAPAMPRAEERRHAALLELGGALEWGRELRAASRLAVGVRRVGPGHFAELALLGRLASEHEESREVGRVREREWSVGLSARLALVRSRFTVGPALELGVVRASASGQTRDGRRGEDTLAFARVAVALDLRLQLARGIQLRFAPGLELDPVAQGFALDGVRALWLGRARATLPLSLVVTLGAGA